MHFYLSNCTKINSEKMNRFSVFRTSLSCFRPSFSILKGPFSVIECPFLLCLVLFCVTKRDRRSKSHTVLFRVLSHILTCCPQPSCPLVRFSACLIICLSRDNEGTYVPLPLKVALSCPVGNINRKTQAVD